MSESAKKIRHATHRKYDGAPKANILSPLTSSLSVD